MNKKNTKSPNPSGGPGLRKAAGSLFECVRHFGPSDDARRHFQTARVEVLKGLRAWIDARIERVSKSGKGERITVE